MLSLSGFSLRSKWHPILPTGSSNIPFFDNHLCPPDAINGKQWLPYSPSVLHAVYSIFHLTVMQYIPTRSNYFTYPFTMNQCCTHFNMPFSSAAFAPFSTYANVWYNGMRFSANWLEQSSFSFEATIWGSVAIHHHFTDVQWAHIAYTLRSTVTCIQQYQFQRAPWKPTHFLIA